MKHVAYVDTRTISNDPVTVTLGEARVKYNVFKDIDSKLVAATTTLADISFRPVVTRGIARVSADDTFDERAGKSISSKKAHIKANVKIQKTIEVAKALLDEAKAKLDAIYSERVASNVALSNDILKHM